MNGSDRNLQAISMVRTYAGTRSAMGSPVQLWGAIPPTHRRLAMGPFPRSFAALTGGTDNERSSTKMPYCRVLVLPGWPIAYHLVAWLSVCFPGP